jgi:hypothetical protein
MKLSKRSGATLLLAVGASSIAGQAVASAAPAAPASPVSAGQVAELENGLASQTVPLHVPLETVTQYAPMLPLGGDISGTLPASPVLPPVPAQQGSTPQDQAQQGRAQQLVPDQLVPQLNFSKVGPGLQAALPLPALADGVRPGTLGLDAPQAPLHAVGPALGVGHPVSYTPGDKPEDSTLAPGDLDPRLVPAAVSLVPGAKASLGGPEQRISVLKATEGLLTTGAAVLQEARDAQDQG